LSAIRPTPFKRARTRSENQNMTANEDQAREREDPWTRRLRRLSGGGPERRFQARPFLLGLSYGFALGIILGAIVAGHP
jgi:hypothetical protein